MSDSHLPKPNYKAVFTNVTAYKVIRAIFNERTTDFSFTFKHSNEKIPSHRTLLAAKSLVFDVMFNGTMREKGEVLITDATPDAFKEFLQFFYEDQVSLSVKNIEQVLYCTDKYGLVDYMHICERFLLSLLTHENLFWNLRLAVLHNLRDLAGVCGAKASEQTKEVFESPSFLTCDRSTLKSILKLDEFSCNETLVFDACMRWAVEQCRTNGIDANQAINLRNQLGDCFTLIRFNEMEKDDFISRFTSNRGMFTASELEDIFSGLCVNDIKNKRFQNKFQSDFGFSKGSETGAKCMHIKEAVDITRLRELSKRYTIESENCDKCTGHAGTGDFGDDRSLWMCLKCGLHLCSRRFNKHALKHYEISRFFSSHAITMNTTTEEIWCYDCEAYLPHIEPDLQQCIELLKMLRSKENILGLY